MEYHIRVDAARLLRQARARSGLSQRQLAGRAGLSQPMISAIERGLQDPRHGTLDKLLRACGQELDLVLKAGEGVDATQFMARLRFSPQVRVDSAVEGSKNVERTMRSLRWSK